jgi:hypothetical protein
MGKKNRKPVKSVGLPSPKALVYIPIVVFFVKILVISRIQGLDWYDAGGQDLGKGLQSLLDSRFVPPNIWFGSDGENYVRGLLGLVKEGIYSQERNLHYWPAGYPILMWGLITLFKGNFFFALSFFQSLVYAVACIYFVEQLKTISLHKVAFPVALALALNPTLSLSTIVVGYESIVASSLLLSIALLISYSRKLEKKVYDLKILLAASLFSSAIFLQPRVIALAIVFFLVWGLAHFKIKALALFLSITLTISFLTSAALAIRNYKAMGFVAVSTNLGVTMNIGAGEGASGGYVNNPKGVQCERPNRNPSSVESSIAEQDSNLVNCVLEWYVKNPSESLRLFWNKSIFFWSPWFGPLATGTMGRNPWLEIHPLKETIKTQSGFDMVAGNFGKVISWGWILGNVLLLFVGWRILWLFGGLQRLWGTTALMLVLVNWLISLVTIGDHRFRIPTMTLSIALQIIALFGFRLRANKWLGTLSEQEISWPVLHWKRKSETDNLQP